MRHSICEDWKPALIIAYGTPFFKLTRQRCYIAGLLHFNLVVTEHKVQVLLYGVHFILREKALVDIQHQLGLTSGGADGWCTPTSPSVSRCFYTKFPV